MRSHAHLRRAPRSDAAQGAHHLFVLQTAFTKNPPWSWPLALLSTVRPVAVFVGEDPGGSRVV